MPAAARTDTLPGAIVSPAHYHATDRQEAAQARASHRNKSRLPDEIKTGTVYIQGNSNHNHRQPGRGAGTDQL
jgi:hypothetical protein